LLFDATLTSCSLRTPHAFWYVSTIISLFACSLACTYLPFSIFGLYGPFSSSIVSHRRSTNVALFIKSAVLRVWLPSLRFASSSKPWKPLSTSNTRGLRPSELWILFDDRLPLYETVCPLLHFPRKLILSLLPMFQWVDPIKKAVPLMLLPKGLIWVGAVCSLELSDLSGFLSLAINSNKLFFLYWMSFSSLQSTLSQALIMGPQGFHL